MSELTVLMAGVLTCVYLVFNSVSGAVIPALEDIAITIPAHDDGFSAKFIKVGE